MRTLCKNEAQRNIMLATVDQFSTQLTALQAANDKKESTQTRKVCLVSMYVLCQVARCTAPQECGIYQ